MPSAPLDTAETRLLHEFFDRAAARFPDRVAVDIPPSEVRPSRRTITYAELAAVIDRLTVEIASRVAPGAVVAILLPRDTEYLYAAQIAVMKAGAAYSCIDPHFPDDHASFILDDAKAALLLTDARGVDRGRRLTGPSREVLPVDEIVDRTGVPRSVDRAIFAIDPSSPVYIIYTSGTTGRPKGVVIEHRSIVNLVASDIAEFAISPGDRVAQGSSPAYDSSIEETWLALAAGATVVCVDDETIRLGPDLLPWLARETITVFCPPPTLLRSMGCSDPQRALPDLKLLYVGGEALPRDVADAWAPGRRLVNGYGPTECTVTVCRGDIVRGGEITIGRAVAGNRAHVLDEQLAPVVPGAEGELCISGAGLARGYLDRPELDREKFPTIDGLGRIYRTGDLVRVVPSGAIEYLGRIDSQVKLRGYRIELEAIDVAILQFPGVLEAAARVEGDGSAAVLVAFVVPVDPLSPPDLTAIKKYLAEKLPEAMVPSRIGVVDRLPRTTGGKLDRKKLPSLRAVLKETPDKRPPQTPHERSIAEAVRVTLTLKETPSTSSDFFADLGGDSLTAALLVSTLRKNPETSALTVRDIYRHRTIAALAIAAENAVDESPPRTINELRPRGRPALATFLQAIWLIVILTIGSSIAYSVIFVAIPEVWRRWGTIGCAAIFPLLAVAFFLAYAVFAVQATALAKRVLIGRYRTMSAPVWGGFYVRHWMLVTLARAIPLGALQGTVFFVWALRSLGAKIGRGVHIHRGVALSRGGWDLLEIGDDAVLAQDAALRLVELRDGRIETGPIKIGGGAKIDVRASVSAHGTVGAGGRLSALSVLLSHQKIGDDEIWDGVPAVCVGRRDCSAARSAPKAGMPPVLFGILLIVARALRGTFVGYLPAVLTVVAAMAYFSVGIDEILDRFFFSGFDARLIGALALLVPIDLLATLILRAVFSRMIGRVEPGDASVTSLEYLRVVLKSENLDAAGNWLSGTIFWPSWLRAAGMKVGKNSEISTIIDVLPELVEIGDECFFADGIYLGCPDIESGIARCGPTRLGKNTFIGNHAYIPGGQSLPDDVLIGLSTVSDDRTISSHSSWFGVPPISLARREAAEMDRTLTHSPSMIRRFTRIFWEALRFWIPVVPVLAAICWIDLAARAGETFESPFVAFVVAPILTFATFFFLAGVVLFLKWFFLGKVRPGKHALWSCWCSRWDFHYVVWTQYALGFLAYLEGSLLLTPYLRAMGSKIGRRVVLGAGFAQVVDPDMLEIEDDATMTGLLQAHTFEDRVLKIDKVVVRRFADVGSGSVLFYGADVGEGAVVASHSVVMKNERLLPGRFYVGCPTQSMPHPIVPERPALVNDVPSEASANRRLSAPDLARGLALLVMMYVHFVPSDAAGGGYLDECLAAFARLFYAKAAALFCVLLGFGIALQHEAAPDPRRFKLRLLRRAAILFSVGYVFYSQVWTTEVLRPLALMTIVVGCAVLGGPRRVKAFFLASLVATPLAVAMLGRFEAIDWATEDMHTGGQGFSLAAVRYLFLNGNYPVIAFSAFPLFGALLARIDWKKTERIGAIFIGFFAAAVATTGYAAWVGDGAERFGSWSPYLGIHWESTSLPFLAMGLSTSGMVIAAAFLWRRFGPPNRSGRSVLGDLGRTTFTHYILHLAIGYAMLRHFYPNEDWRARVGFGVFLITAIAAAILSHLWLRRFRRGPLESILM